MRKQQKKWQILLGSKVTADGDCSHEIKRHLLLGRKALTSRQCTEKCIEITLPTKIHVVKAMVFFSRHAWMWVLDHNEGWVPKNWCFWTVVLEKTLESPLDCKEMKAVNPNGNKPWIFIGSYFAQAEILILWPPDAKNWLWEKAWCWESLSAEGEGPSRRWDVQTVQLIWCTWVWANSAS